MLGFSWEWLAVMAAQVALVVHVLRTGRNRLWVFLLIFAPVIGGVAYLLVELLPEFAGSLTGRRAMRSVRTALNPGGDVRRHAAAWQHSPNVDNARRYAGALLAAGRAAEADEVLREAMTGLFRTEPSLMLLRGRVLFEEGDAAGAARLLDEMRAANPEFRSPDGHLLLARALAAAGEQERALTELREVSGYFPGAEARFRLGQALQEAGHPEEARAVWQQLEEDARHAPSHYRRAQREWLARAARGLRELS